MSKTVWGGGYSVEEYEALKSQLNLLQQETEQVKQAFEVGKLQYLSKYSSSSYVVPELLQQLSYVSKTQEALNYKGWKVLKPFILRAIAFRDGTASLDLSYIYRYRGDKAENWSLYTSSTSSIMREIEFDVGDTICLTASRSYGGPASANIPYQIIDPALTE